MLDILAMMSNYNDRVIDRYEQGELVVDTCRVTDGNQPYETGIKHPKYNNGKWVIVEAYDTLKDAKTGHTEWVKKMTAKTLPKALVDCSNSYIQQLVDRLDDNDD